MDWYRKSGRKDLPWQKDRSPYKVWVSEIMLQQTQVSTVLPYFEKFMQTFPDVHTLAHASQDEVLHHWTGLGYYRRAHYLHQTARILVEKYHGQFPHTVEHLSELPGIGRSTAGAIVAMGFNQKAPILDGNVRRVLSRFHAVSGLNHEKMLWHWADLYTPEKNPRDYTQAMMDIGATVCKKHQPACSVCPLKKECKAFREGRQEDFPAKKPSKILPIKKIILLIFLNKKNHVLLEKRPSHGIWSGLWSLPECATQTAAKKQYGSLIKTWTALSPFRHTFSHFHLDIFPLKGKIMTSLQQKKILKDLAFKNKAEKYWYDPLSPKALGLSAPVKKIIEKYLTPFNETDLISS